jgi:hypothetical protein
MRFLLLTVSVLLSFFSTGQTFEDWSRLVAWDGVTPWQNYIVFSPRFMGPNALPIPEMSKGTADSVHAITVSGAFHFSRGDHTQNLKLHANYCLARDRVSFDITWIPIEWYEVSSEIKEERHVYHLYYYDKKARGDVLINMNIQVLNRWREFVQLSLRTGYRFPTSSETGGARFTDAPGYYFDLSAAKPITKDQRWKLSGMAGFYAWQTDKTGQNDAFLFGAAIELNQKGWHWQFETRGYNGYKKIGDCPIVVGTELRKTIRPFSFGARLRQGIRDYPFTTLELGTSYIFPD